jgi:hypothetical protein
MLNIANIVFDVSGHDQGIHILGIRLCSMLGT